MTEQHATIELTPEQTESALLLASLWNRFQDLHGASLDSACQHTRLAPATITALLNQTLAIDKHHATLMADYFSSLCGQTLTPSLIIPELLYDA